MEGLVWLMFGLIGVAVRGWVGVAAAERIEKVSDDREEKERSQE
jgi:hypothetical protein